MLQLQPDDHSWNCVKLGLVWSRKGFWAVRHRRCGFFRLFFSGEKSYRISVCFCVHRANLEKRLPTLKEKGDIYIFERVSSLDKYLPYLETYLFEVNHSSDFSCYTFFGFCKVDCLCHWEISLTMVSSPVSLQGKKMSKFWY